MKCLETRQRHGMKWRRYRTDDGRTITTFEVPTAVLSKFSRKQLDAQLQAWTRGEASRARKARVIAQLQAGVKPLAVAAAEGLTETRVYQIRKEICP